MSGTEFAFGLNFKPILLAIEREGVISQYHAETGDII